MAAKVKQNANTAMTFLQIARARYGTPVHLLFTLVSRSGRLVRKKDGC